MPEQILHGADVGARLEQVAGERVEQGAYGDVCGDASPSSALSRIPRSSTVSNSSLTSTLDRLKKSIGL